MRRRILLSVVAWAVILGAAVAPGQQPARPRWEAPPLERAISIRDGRTDKTVTLEQLLADLAQADVVFLGENHTDETTHRVELAVYEGLLARRGNRVTLAMEMFERDVQPALDAYLKGEMEERTFLQQARPWANYRTAYRPLIERAKANGTPVLASNFPRPLIPRLAADGPQVLDSLPAETRGQAPATFLPNPDSYWRRVDNAIRGHAGMMRESDRLYSTQSLWDNAMGETCAKALDRFPENSVLHVNGDFHSSYWEGSVHQLRQRKPDAKIKTVSIVPVNSPTSVRLEGLPAADYVIFAEARATDVSDGRWAVYTRRETKYLFHLPAVAREQPQKVPLAVVLVDDGLSADDGFQYWREQLGEHAALMVIEPNYKETQEDLGVGGRWFWADSFSSDVGTAIGGIEEAWAYVMRHYPIDPQRVVVVGEGTGATIAAAVGVMTDRIDLTAIAHAPRQYAKLKDFALPLPEAWGEETPPKRSLTVFVGSGDEPWWTPEAKAYQDVGVPTTLTRLDADPWKRDVEFRNALRGALGLPTSAPPETRGYLLLDSDAPRARQWARMQALWAGARDGLHVVPVAARPSDASATEMSTLLRPENLTAPGALPRCPGPFGGTTVLVLPADTPEPEVKDWVAVEENDPLSKQSRFHRLRIATAEGERALPAVLAKLQSENRKNILIVPAAFHAGGDWLRTLRRSVRHLEDQMTLQWQPGLGGVQAAFAPSEQAVVDLPLQHRLDVKLLPADHVLQVENRLQLPPALRGAGTAFKLNKALTVRSSNVPLTREEPAEDQPTATYKLAAASSDGTLVLTYDGPMHFGLSDQKEEYTRGFRDTLGIVSSEGVYLDAKSAWIPVFDDRMIRFQLAVQLPEKWHVISQGKGTSRDETGVARWQSDGPMEEVYLVGGPLFRATDMAGAVEISVYLREQDEALSRKYLDTGARYLEMYRSLIGTYPYAKFAVVENFWETGYGMPSFTLLGPQVIRFPFILHSSYPHEILHNWWGNSVFVDYSQGNWCEGLTAYMADHLIQEQRGGGAEYRRNSLQRYRDYVREGRDFPLVEFHSRHSAATEAVGYGKALMFFHMLRQTAGDDAFKASLAAFYGKHRGTRASFDDIRAAFESSSSGSLQPFFDQWIRRTGAPRLELRNVAAKRQNDRWVISGSLEQTQNGEPYQLAVPVVIQTAEQTAWVTVEVNERSTPLRLQIEQAPLVLSVDPAFDLFRLLDPRETPPSIGQVFGQPKILAVLPAAASERELAGYRELIEAWQSDEHKIESKLDKDMAGLPQDQAVWLLGRTNRFVPELLKDHTQAALAENGTVAVLNGERVPLAGNSIVVMRRHPQNLEQAIGWIAVDPLDAIPGMARKLPHYGKYSYLAFEGTEPTNTVKGQYDTFGSPLVVDLREDRSAAVPFVAAADRKALAELPPVFSGKVLKEHVDWLASPEREGRGLGTAGLQQSAEYIAKAMADAGLKPAGDNGGWFQKFTVAKGPGDKPVETVNVVGMLPGHRADWKDQSVILSAHYDHLGRGWPDVHAGDEGKLHPGADDNASGVAVMLELARVLAEEGGGARNLICIAFSAEECGRLGSRHYVEHPVAPVAEIRGVINLDAVGRLADGQISVLGTGTADEWQHIFRGCTFVTGIPSKNIPEAAGGSDQMSFIEKGVPGVQIFTGAHADYHRPGDTPDKIDVAGLVKVATFVKEAVTYMLDREPPLAVRIEGSTPPATTTSPQEGGRRVVFGAVPAFDYQGDGVKFESLVADSPAARAGLQAGDILVQLGQVPIKDLRGFSEALKKLEPGQTVVAKVLRDGKPRQVSVTVEKR